LLCALPCLRDPRSSAVAIALRTVTTATVLNPARITFSLATGPMWAHAIDRRVPHREWHGTYQRDCLPRASAFGPTFAILMHSSLAQTTGRSSRVNFGLARSPSWLTSAGDVSSGVRFNLRKEKPIPWTTLRYPAASNRHERNAPPGAARTVRDDGFSNSVSRPDAANQGGGLDAGRNLAAVCSVFEVGMNSRRCRRRRSMRMIYSARSLADAIFRDELNAMARRDDSLSVIYALTREQPEG
jgi:hypothetical protein